MKKEQNITRREFTKKAIVAGAAMELLGSKVNARPSASENAGRTPVALQLYTVRTLTEKDYSGTLEKVARIGYDAVEFGGFGGLSSKQIKKLLDDLGLQSAGSHVDIAELESELTKIIDFHLEIGAHYIICPYMPEPVQEEGVRGFQEFGKRLEKIGEPVKKAGLQLCYHNHNFEFKKANGKYLLDYLFESADPELVKAEVDVYWVKRGGEDPVAHLRKYRGRCSSLHMKDMTRDDRKTYAPVGTGQLNFPEIIRTAKEIGAVWFVVEQDEADQPILDAISISLKNMRQMLKG